eukprot:TRINITY_DN6674_c0_g1_i1.p1 TRINITY_DN6674_c0_g1~~TRINITY_DN6674_c0_g1_i1.p1  ORF type:complete len:958 (+),score=246.82 TRINITY_DN6674_c0_g1_i1:97-2874(+)
MLAAPVTSPGGQQQLERLRAAVAAVVRDADRPGSDDGDSLRTLLERHEELCGPAGRTLVTLPLLSALHSRVSVLGGSPPSTLTGQWTKGFFALQLLRDLAQAGIGPRSVPEAAEARGSGGAEGAGVTARALVSSANATIHTLASTPLLLADDSSMEPQQADARRLLVSAFDAAWGLVGALSPEDPLGAAAPLRDALCDPHMKHVLADHELLGPFFEAAVATAGELATAGAEPEAVSLLTELFCLDTRPCPNVAAITHRARREGKADLSANSAYGVTAYLAAVRDWATFRASVARRCALLLDWQPLRRRQRERQRKGAGWFTRTAAGLWASMELRPPAGRLRAATVDALVAVWRRGGSITAMWSAVLCALGRLPPGALTPAQHDTVHRLCRDFFVRRRRSAAYGCFANLPGVLRERATELSVMLGAAAAQPFHDTTKPQWLAAAGDEHARRFAARAVDCFFACSLSHDMLYPDEDGKKFSSVAFRYAHHIRDVWSIYPTLAARLLIASGALAECPAFPSRLLRHAQDIVAYADALTQHGEAAQQALQSVFRLGGVQFRYIVMVVSRVAAGAALCSASASQLLQAVRLSWRFFGHSTYPPPAPHGSAQESQLAAVQRLTAFLDLDQALAGLLTAADSSTAESSLHRVRQLRASRGRAPFVLLDLRFELLLLRVAHDTHGLCIPEHVTKGCLELSLNLLPQSQGAAASRRRAVAHALFVAACSRPGEATTAAVLRYLHLCTPTRAGGGEGGGIAPDLGRLPSMRVVALFVEGSTQLVRHLDDWGDARPAQEQGADGLSGVGVQLYAVACLDTALAALADPAAAAALPGHKAPQLRGYRNMYTAALLTFVSSQSPRVVTAAAAAIERALRRLKAQRTHAGADVAFWLRQLAHMVKTSSRVVTRHERVRWVMELERSLLGVGAAARPAKL